MAGCHHRRLGQRWNQRRLVALLVAPCTLTPQPIPPRWDRPVGSRRRWGCFRQRKGSAWAASLQRSRQSRCTSEPHRQSRRGPWPRQRLAWGRGGAGEASSLFKLCGFTPGQEWYAGVETSGGLYTGDEQEATGCAKCVLQLQHWKCNQCEKGKASFSDTVPLLRFYDKFPKHWLKKNFLKTSRASEKLWKMLKHRG